MDYFGDAIKAALQLIANLDREVYLIVWTSVKISLCAVMLASVIAIPLGLFVGFSQFPGRGILLRALNAAMALPTVVIGLLLYGLLSRNGALGDLGLLYTPYAMVIGQAVLVLPIIWNLGITAVTSADPRLLLTCRSLGAGRIQQALIFLSEVRAGFMAAIVVGLGRAIGEIGVAMMLGGNIQGYTRTMTTAIALETSKGEFELALALGILLIAVAFLLNTALAALEPKPR